MKSATIKKIQISLIFVGLMLVAITYFIYPRLIPKISENIIDEQTKKEEITDETSFTNVEYDGLTNKGSPYTVSAEFAKTDPDNSDIVFLEFVTATFYYSNVRVVVTSSKGKFNKISGDLNFKENVKMVDSDNNKLTAENLDMLISQDYAAAWKDVKLLTKNGQYIIADKILFDAIEKTFKISMTTENLEKDKKIKIKLIQ